MGNCPKEYEEALGDGVTWQFLFKGVLIRILSESDFRTDV